MLNKPEGESPTSERRHSNYRSERKITRVPPWPAAVAAQQRPRGARFGGGGHAGRPALAGRDVGQLCREPRFFWAPFRRQLDSGPHCFS